MLPSFSFLSDDESSGELDTFTSRKTPLKKVSVSSLCILLPLKKKLLAFIFSPQNAPFLQARTPLSPCLPPLPPRGLAPVRPLLSRTPLLRMRDPLALTEALLVRPGHLELFFASPLPSLCVLSFFVYITSLYRRLVNLCRSSSLPFHRSISSPRFILPDLHLGNTAPWVPGELRSRQTYSSQIFLFVETLLNFVCILFADLAFHNVVHSHPFFHPVLTSFSL
jgi:hypothetical protein